MENGPINYNNCIALYTSSSTCCNISLVNYELFLIGYAYLPCVPGTCSPLPKCKLDESDPYNIVINFYLLIHSVFTFRIWKRTYYHNNVDLSIG